MAQINIARHLAHRDGIKIVDKNNNGCYLRGYNVSESIEAGKIDITLYYFDDARGAWIVSDFDSSCTTFTAARESARQQLRR